MKTGCATNSASAINSCSNTNAAAAGGFADPTDKSAAAFVATTICAAQYSVAESSDSACPEATGTAANEAIDASI